MKKRMIPLLVLVLILCLPVYANAFIQASNSFTASPKATVSGTTAICSLKVDARRAGTNASISASIELELKVGTAYTKIASWSPTGTRTLNFSES